MFKCKNKTAPIIFHSIFQEKRTKYPLRRKNQVIEQNGRITNNAKFSISYRCPFIWNRFLATEETLPQEISFNSFKQKIRKIISAKPGIQTYF